MKIAYLQIIQKIIARFANNSFLIKGWAITINVAFIAIVGKDLLLNKKFILLGIIPTLLFWFMDGYYLSLERKYINLYNHARTLGEKDVDFSLDIDSHKTCQTNWVVSTFSKSLNIFYIAIAVTIIFLYFFL